MLDTYMSNKTDRTK